MAIYLSRKKGGTVATPITPSNANPAQMTADVAVNPTANGYAIESYSSITPSNSSPATITSGSIYKASANGKAVASVTDVTPSSTPTSVSSGSVVKFGAYGLIVDSVPLVQGSKTVTATTSQQTVAPDTGYDSMAEVVVNPQVHTQTYTPADDTAANDMGVNNNYRYVDTSGMVTPTSITPSNFSPAEMTTGNAYTPSANAFAIEYGKLQQATPSNSSPVSVSGGIAYNIGPSSSASGYLIESYDSVTPSDSTPPQLSQGGIYIPTSNGYLYENQQGGSVEPDQVETYKNVANNGTKTITVSQMPKYITYFYTYYSSTNGGMFLILDVANNKAYRYGYWGNAFHNEDYTSGYSSYITSVSASSVTIKNAYGSAGNITIGIYY